MSSNILLYPILLPLIAGAVCFLLSKKWMKEVLSLVAMLATFILAIFIFGSEELIFTQAWLPILGGINFSLRSYHFSSFILIFLALFGVLISLYSVKFMRGKERLKEYYAYLLWTIAASSGAILASNLIVFLLFWGALGLLLYALLSLGSYRVATKGLLIIGASDFALILGVLFLYHLSGTLEIKEIGSIPLNSALSIFAFILLATGALAKAGAMPFHTWIPEAAEKAPLPVMALLPASLDKLLGIYFLYRICLDFFHLYPNSGLSLLLMLVGSFTIVAMAMMALVQNDLKRLLSYQTVSQVGYMVLGIGTGIPLAIAGGIFHMLNHTIYEVCLFLGGGSVEHRKKTTQLNKLGGLARMMPITFVTFFIAALSISGVPPFNGFFSKWMIYQGVVELGRLGGGGNFWIIWLLAALFGSALTLASFIKLIHATFLGTPSTSQPEDMGEKARKLGFSMALPMIVLASLCVVFGVFAYRIPLKLFILDSVAGVPPSGEWLGWWRPGLTTTLIIIGLVIGGVIYLLSKVKLFREDTSYIGGEEASPEMKVSGVEFYDTVRDFSGLKGIYGAAQKKKLDFYNWGMSFCQAVAWVLRGLDRLVNYVWEGLASLVVLMGRGGSRLHNGILHTYLAWCLLGLMVLLVVFLVL
ncbi:proton-conducting membrane transporter [Candidatus Aerophobetes bacterium Ae_b3a]|nr:MAG: proton-conducting membrane transporter [Candidatus Aerophobetes bacterium Ae_b3a]